MSNCQLCGHPMPLGEEMFNYHGYSGPCPAPPLPKGTVERQFGFVEALKVATRVFEKYREDHPKLWKAVDGTPLLNDIPVRMAEAFLAAFRCEFLCGIHADLDKSGNLRAFENCLACIRAENTELNDHIATLSRQLDESQKQAEFYRTELNKWRESSDKEAEALAEAKERIATLEEAAELGTCDCCNKKAITVSVETGFAGETENLCGRCISTGYFDLEKSAEHARERIGVLEGALNKHSEAVLAVCDGMAQDKARDIIQDLALSMARAALAPPADAKFCRSCGVQLVPNYMEWCWLHPLGSCAFSGKESQVNRGRPGWFQADGDPMVAPPAGAKEGGNG